MAEALDKIVINSGVTFYFSGHTCYDIDIQQDVSEITFTGIATNEPVLINEKMESLPKCLYNLKNVKKQFPNVKKITLLDTVGYYREPPIHISNFMFPNVKSVVSYCDRFPGGRTLQIKANDGNILLNSFCMKEYETLDLQGVSDIYPFALEGCMTSKVINTDRLIRIWRRALKGSVIDMEDHKDSVLLNNILVKVIVDEYGLTKVPENTRCIAKNINFNAVKTLEIHNPELIDTKYNHIFEKIVLKTEEKKILDTNSVMFSLTQNIEVSDKNPYYKTVDGILYSKNGKTLLKCPKCRTDDVVIPDGVERIAPYAFELCRFKSVSMPDTLIHIGKFAFLSCEDLKYVDLGRGITRLGGGQTGDIDIFDSCKNLHHITFPRQLKIIGEGAFKNSGLQEIILNEGLEVIEKEAFTNLSCHIDILKFPSSLQYIGKYNLESVDTVDISDCIPLDFIKAVHGGKRFGYLTIIYKSHRTMISELLNKNSIDSIQQLLEFNCSDDKFIDGLFLFSVIETDRDEMSIKLYKKYKNPCAKEYIKQNFIQIAQRQLNYGSSESFYELLNLRLATKNQLAELLHMVQSKDSANVTMIAEVLEKMNCV